MDFIDVIGLVISLLALVYIFFKNSRQELQHRQKQASQVEQEEEEDEEFEDYPLTEWMKGMEKEAMAREGAQHLPPPPPKVVKQPKKPTQAAVENAHFASKMEKRQLKSSLENRDLKSPLENRKLKPSFIQHQEMAVRVKPPALTHRIEDSLNTRPSRAQVVFQRLSHRRDLIIYQEIIDKPKSLRPHP